MALTVASRVVQGRTTQHMCPAAIGTHFLPMPRSGSHHCRHWVELAEEAHTERCPRRHCGVSIVEVDLDYHHRTIDGGGGIDHGYLERGAGVGHSTKVAHGGELRN